MINYLSQIDRKILCLIWNIRYNPIEAGNQKIPAIAISTLHSSESYTQCNNKGNRNMSSKIGMAKTVLSFAYNMTDQQKTQENQ